MTLTLGQASGAERWHAGDALRERPLLGPAGSRPSKRLPSASLALGISSVTRGARSEHPGERLSQDPPPGTPGHVSRVFPVPRREVSTSPGQLTQPPPAGSGQTAPGSADSRQGAERPAQMRRSPGQGGAVPAARRRRARSVPAGSGQRGTQPGSSFSGRCGSRTFSAEPAATAESQK